MISTHAASLIQRTSGTPCAEQAAVLARRGCRAQSRLWTLFIGMLLTIAGAGTAFAQNWSIKDGRNTGCCCP